MCGAVSNLFYFIESDLNTERQEGRGFDVCAWDYAPETGRALFYDSFDFILLAEKTGLSMCRGLDKKGANRNVDSLLPLVTPAQRSLG